MKKITKKVIFITIGFIIAMSLCGIITFVFFGIASSDKAIIKKITYSLRKEENRQILLSWVDDIFPTAEATQKMALITCDDLLEDVVPGKKVNCQGAAKWMQSGVWAKEVRLIKSAVTKNYSAVYFGNARYGVVVKLSYINEDELGLRLDKQYVVWHKDRIYIITGPLFVAGRVAGEPARPQRKGPGRNGT